MTPVCTRRTELLPALLCAVLLVAFSPLPAAATLDNDFNDPKRCAACHPDIFCPDESLRVPVIRMAESGYSFEKPAAKAAATR
jgi:hypothetical protein